MGLPGASKTPTGAWSTRANVLEELAEEQGIEIARKILDWLRLPSKPPPVASAVLEPEFTFGPEWS